MTSAELSETEGRCISKCAANAGQRPLRQLHRHDRIRWKGTRQIPRCLEPKPEPGVIVFVTDDNHNPFAAATKLAKTASDQMTANSTFLMAWTHSHRSKRNRRQPPLPQFDGHSAEQNMANDPALDLGHERKQDDSLFSQSVNQIRLIGAFESGFVYLPYFGVIPRPLLPDVNIRLHRHRHSCIGQAVAST
jgi:hypothetical protein